MWAAAYLGHRVSAVSAEVGLIWLLRSFLRSPHPLFCLLDSEDSHVLDVNESALHLLGSVGCSELVMMLHAGHLFEGPGQLDEMADRAAEWLKQHLTSRH